LFAIRIISPKIYLDGFTINGKLVAVLYRWCNSWIH